VAFRTHIAMPGNESESYDRAVCILLIGRSTLLALKAHSQGHVNGDARAEAS
jgi:hypothetical protein